MDDVLEAKGLCKTYGHYKALDHLCMHVPKGAIYGFVGKNGAGKTTLIRLITGLQFPTGGRRIIDQIAAAVHLIQQRIIRLPNECCIG